MNKHHRNTVWCAALLIIYRMTITMKDARIKGLNIIVKIDIAIKSVGHLRFRSTAFQKVPQSRKSEAANPAVIQIAPQDSFSASLTRDAQADEHALY